MKRPFFMLFVLIGCYVLRSSVISKPINYRSSLAERKLYNAIRRHKAAVVLLDAPEKKGRRRVCNNGSKVRNAFMRLSRSGYYPRRAVGFMQVDLKTPAGKTFVVDNNIKTDALPAIVLFSDGVPLEDQHGIITLAGNTNRETLKKAIDDYLHVDIAQYVQQERTIKKYEDVLRDRAHVYYSPYFSKVANPWNGYWGWPYYGMAQGHYGGNAGIVSTGNGIGFFGANY